MSSRVFGAFIQHETGNSKSDPGFAQILPRDLIARPAPTEQELDDLRWGSKLNGPPEQRTASVVDSSIPATPRELEESRPSTPTGNVSVDAIVQSATNPPMNRFRLLAAAVMFMLMGFHDSATGALIPSIEKHYKITYDVVSLIFVGNALGFITAAPIGQLIDGRWGRSRAYILCVGLVAIGYIALTCTPPFPVAVVAYYFVGFGAAVFLGTANVFIINLQNGTVLLGFMHGMYGVGGIVSPLIATAMVSKGLKWSYYYFITLGLSIISLGLLGWSFRGFEKDNAVQLVSAVERTASRQAAGVDEPNRMKLLRQSMKTKVTWLGAFFIFFYQGAEVAISGWVISYLITYRKGAPSKVGNVTSGFWGGITAGRFLLTHLAHRVGEKTAVYVLIFGAAVFQALVWAVPNIISNAVAESIVGLFLGPIYPCGTAVFSKLLPRNIQNTSISVVTSMGSSGGAGIPFITGLMARYLGTVVLNPIVLISFLAMVVVWSLLPNVDKRTE